MQARPQLGQILWHTGGDDFDITGFGVSNPATQGEFPRLAVNEPAEPYTLYTTAN